MRIFFASQSFYPNIGGVSTYLLNLLKKLNERGVEVKEFHLRLMGMELKDKIKGIDVERVPQKPLTMDLLDGYSKFKENFQKAILLQKNDFSSDVYEMEGYKEFFDINQAFGEGVSALLEDYPAEIVHVHDFQLVHLYKYVPRGTPLILTWHGPFYSRFKKSLKKFIIEQMMEYDKVIFSSEEYRKSAIKAGLPREKTAVIHPIANTDIFKPIKVDKNKIKEKYGIPNGSKMILCVQRIDWRSSHKQLIKSMAKVAKEVPDAVLVFAGEKSMSQKMSNHRDSERENIRKLVKELGLSKKVFFIGNVNYFKIPRLYNTADVIASTPKMEAFGLSVTEGMACGKPVVGTKVGGIPLQIQDNVNGFLVEAEDVSDTADKLIKLLKSSKLRKKMGEESQRIVDKKFKLDKRIEEHIVLYRKLLKKKSDKWRISMLDPEEIQAVITDLDGTLRKTGKKINPDVIRKLKSLKIPHILVTGRHLDYVKRLYSTWKIWDIIVAENGSIIYFPKEDRILSINSEKMDSARKILKKSDIKCHFGEIIISTKLENRKKLKKLLKPLNKHLNYETNIDEMMVLPKGVNKGTGTLLALQNKEIDPEKTVIVGDAENDINLFNVPGYRIAVSNAHKKLKSVADEVTEQAAGKGVTEIVNTLKK